MRRIHELVKLLREMHLDVLVPTKFKEYDDLDNVKYVIYKYRSMTNNYVYIIYPESDFHTLEAYLKLCLVGKHDCTGEFVCYITDKKQIPDMMKVIL